MFQEPLWKHQRPQEGPDSTKSWSWKQKCGNLNICSPAFLIAYPYVTIEMFVFTL